MDGVGLHNPMLFWIKLNCFMQTHTMFLALCIVHGVLWGNKDYKQEKFEATVLFQQDERDYLDDVKNDTVCSFGYGA